MAFVNGLPLGIIELKNPADTHADVWKAYQQLQTYKDEIADCSSSTRRWWSPMG